MQRIVEQWQFCLMVFSLSGLALIGVGLLFAALAPALRQIWRICKLDSWSKLLALPFVVMITLHGMTKHQIGHVSYPATDAESRYLIDNGSYVTNNAVHVDFSRSAVVPDSAPFLGWYRPLGMTNDTDWVQFLDTTFAAFPVPSDIPFENAISNNFIFATTWTPGPTVHTNGVAIIVWQRQYDPALATNIFAMIRTGVYTNGVRVAPNPGITNSWGGVGSLLMSTPNEETEDE